MVKSYHPPEGTAPWGSIFLALSYVTLLIVLITEVFAGHWFALYMIVIFTLPIWLSAYLMWSTARSQKKHPERWY